MEPPSPRSLCLFISHFWPVASGAENQAYMQGVELVRRGYGVHVLTRRVSGYPKNEVRDGLNIHRWLRPIRFGSLFGASFLTQGARALLRLRKDIDLVHTHQGLWEAAAAGLARRRLGKPVLVQPAAGGVDGEMQALARTGGRTFLRQLILRNDHFAAISQEIAAELRATGVPPERITETASGVDTERFAPGESPLEDQLPARPRVLFVGRLAEQKNLALLLHAWSEVTTARSGAQADSTGTRGPGDEGPSGAEDGDSKCQGECLTEESSVPRTIPPSPRFPLPASASLLLAGDGAQRDELRALADDLNVTDTVHFLGDVESVEDYLRAADLFVLPSRAEGSPNALLEAMSAALPCVVSRIGGNVDLVEDGISGVVVSQTAPEEWSKAILRLLDDAPAAHQMGAAARRWILNRRSLPAVVDRYEAVYRSLFRPRSDDDVHE